MTAPNDHQAKLVHGLLSRTEEKDAASNEHPDDELLALFAEGTLLGEAHADVVRHLAECSPCRQIVSHVLTMADDAAEETVIANGISLRQTAKPVPWWMERRVWAAAAAVLLVVGVGYISFGPIGLNEQTAYVQAAQLLEASKFDQVHALIKTAAQRGIHSNRLRSLDAQAARQIPAVYALAYAGRLNDFGYDLGGVVARDPAQMPNQKGVQEAENRLPPAGTEDLDVLLNRGHLLLTQQKPEAAFVEFQTAVRQAPKNELAWLGLGLAAFLNEDYVKAEEAFRQVLVIHSGNIAARFNLAMTLDEQNKFAAAIEIWQELLMEKLASADRAKIEAIIEQRKKELRVMVGRLAQIIAILALVTTSVGLTNDACGEGYAIVVGVNDCPNFLLPNGARPRPLRGAESDADLVAETLIKQFAFAPQNVVLLKGPEATDEKLRSTFQQWAKKIGPQDVFVFHFSGHGTQVPDQKPFDEADGLDEALCLADTTAEGRNLVLDDELGIWLDKIVAKEITVLLDCCHSGTAIKDVDDDLAARYLPFPHTASDPGKVERPWRDLHNATKGFGQRMTAFYACQPEQQAYERRLPHQTAPARSGQFSFYLLEGLKNKKADMNADGRVSNQEAFEYARSQLNDSFNRSRLNARERQEPLLESDAAEGDVFGSNARLPVKK